MTQSVWKIEMFGRLVAQREERRIAQFRTEKTGVLLATLAQQPGQSYWRGELCANLWPAYCLESVPTHHKSPS